MYKNGVSVIGALLLLSFWTSLGLAQKEYPPLYPPDLPRYENAVLVDTGRQTESLKGGLRLTLNTPDPVSKVAEFYEARLKELGWELPIPGTPSGQDRFYVGHFRKGDLFFQIVITRMDTQNPPTSRIQITYGEH